MSKSARSISLRLALPSDREALEALMWRASVANEQDRTNIEANPEVIHVPEGQIAQGDVLVAEVAGRLAGFASVVVEEDHAELEGLFVEPELWRQGAGAALVDATVHEARKMGLSLVVIANPAAREFYERCGFTLEGDAETRFGSALRMSR